MSAPPLVQVRNSQRKVAVRVRELQAFANVALKAILASAQGERGVLHTLEEVDVLLVSDRRIAALHKRFMNIAGPTDVLTFQHGEIFVSTETARVNARRFATTADAEIRLYIVHGLLHLAGFDDTTEATARAMAKEQERIVAAATAAL